MVKNKPDWKWDWDVQNKFMVICGEFGGNPIIGSSFFNKDDRDGPLFCEIFEDYDNFRAFAHWMDRLPRGHKTKSLKAIYEYDEGSDTFTAELELNGERPKKTVSVSNRRYISSSDSLDEYILEELGANNDWPWPFVREQHHAMEEQKRQINMDAIYDEASSDKIIKEIKKPYLHQHTSLAVDYNGNDEAIYAKASINIPLSDGLVLSSVLQDAADAVEQITNEANDVFYKKLDEQIKKINSGQ